MLVVTYLGKNSETLTEPLIVGLEILELRFK